jgi:hypothetical protein
MPPPSELRGDADLQTSGGRARRTMFSRLVEAAPM